jgi:Rieske Fe-S protein
MERRSFLKWVTHGLGVLFAVLLGIPAMAYLIDARNRPARKGDFKPVGRLEDLVIGVPTQVVIRDIRSDAWTLHPSDVLGRVWLIRRDDKNVEAFTTICPHLGCSINYEDKAKLFICPCHNGTFDLAGSRVERPGLTNPAPRGMDQLEVRVLADSGIVEVYYQNFIQGRHEKIVKT